MPTWFDQHVPLSSWLSTLFAGLSTVFALVAMLRASKRDARPLKLNQTVLGIGFLLCLAGVLVSSLPKDIRVALIVLTSALMSWVGVLAVRE